MRRHVILRRELWIAMAAVLLMVVLAIGAMVGLMYSTFDTELTPQVTEKSRTAARSLTGVLGQAARFELPVEKLVGVEELFADVVKKHPEIARIELTRAGKSAFSYGPEVNASTRSTLPIPEYETDKAGRVELQVLVDPKFIRNIFAELSLDLVVVAVVALFVSLELLYFLVGGLLSDLAAIRAQVAALARGAFVPLKRSTWIGRDLSAAMADRAAQVTALHEKVVANFRQRWAKRTPGDRGVLRQAITDFRALRTRFSFTDTRGARGSNEAALILGAMRAPFFLLLLADDLSRSFLPMFASGLEVGALRVAPSTISSLPIVSFMLVVALSQPVFGGWSERIGRRRSFLVGALLACLAHFCSAQATSLVELLVWRCAGGAAWAIAFVAAQGYVLDHTDAKTRTAGLAAFVGIIMVSLICGPSIGGILADGIGHRLTLALGGLLTLAALLLAWRRLPPDKTAIEAPTALGSAVGTTSAAKPIANARGIPRLGIAFSNRRFLALLLLAAVPAKIIMIAYCFYLIPLWIVEVGSTSAMAGRLIMLYSVMMVLMVPLMANWVVTLRARHANAPEAKFVAVGLALSGIAGLAMAYPIGLLSPLLVVVLLGLGQSLSISPQAAMVAEVCKDEIATLGQSTVYGVYRMVERLGNASGPLLAAVLLSWGGYQTAFVGIALLVLVCAALFALLFLVPRKTPSLVPA